MATNSEQRKRVSKSTTKRNTSHKKATNSKTPMRREIKIFIMASVSFFLLLFFYSPWLGSFVRNIGLAFLGNSAYALPLILCPLFMHIAIKGSLGKYLKTYICLFSVLVLSSMYITIENAHGTAHYLDAPTLFEGICQLIDGGTSGTDGGIIGALGILCKSFCPETGVKIVIIFAIFVLISVATNFLPIIWLVNGTKKLFSFMNQKFEEHKDASKEEPEEEKSIKKTADKDSDSEYPKQVELNLDEKEEKKRYRLPKRPDKNTPVTEEATKEPSVETKREEVNLFDDFNINIYIPEEKDEQNIAPLDTSTIIPSDASEDASKEDIPLELTPIVEPSSEDAPVAKKKVPNVAIELTEEDFIVETKPYEFPPITLLDNSIEKSSNAKGPDLREQAKVLIETLKSFGVEAKILEVNKGPTVTRFELQPATGVKVSKITGLADDIALNLAALSVRIEAPIPGKAAVGIEIPNSGNSIVRLREVIDSDAFKSFKAKTAFALGKDIAGTPVVTDIAKMPHALIAGATGSGKSVCINALITSIIYKADPKDVKFIMIDPKVVELSVYNGIPHLLIPVVTDPRKAAGALNWAVQEMTKRYKMFADNNVRDIKGYNELAQLNGEKTLEQIIIIVDELADLMMVAPRDVEDAICRLAQMARAAGMHLVIATQRPSVDVITGVIKANVPSRIAFAVSSQIDSRTILDMGGAEKLLGKGDMLFLPMGASKPTRIQGAFISDKEVEKIVEFVKSTDVKYDEDVLEKIENGVSGEKESDGGDADELLPQAIEIVVEAGQASASLLQRRLKVGYSRAGRLIDQLEARGIIGPYEGAKPRAVLMSRAEYAEMTMQTE